METGRCGPGPVRISEALKILGEAVRERGSGAPPAVWFKESSPRNLRSRDFLVPRGALRKSFPAGEVPDDLIHKLMSLQIPEVPIIQSCLQNEAGLIIQLDRPAVFQRVLTDFSPYSEPSPLASDSEQRVVVLNCAPLHGCENLGTFKLSHLRAVLVADHLAAVLRKSGVQVHLIPAVHSQEVKHFLHQLKVSWPFVSAAPAVQETVSAFGQHLKEWVHADKSDADSHPPREEPLPPVLYNVRLRHFAEKQRLSLEGYDPNLDVFLVSEENLRQVAELQTAVQQSLDAEAQCTVLHVVSCEEEFHQQKLDLLWRMLDCRACRAVSQKHLVCAPVKVLNSPSPVSCTQYFHLRKSQMHEASAMKYGDLVQDHSWGEIINFLTSAAIKFEMLATAHRCQVTLDLEDAKITTKGTKSGAFVMYNCARLATLFESYNCAVRRGLYPAFPAAGEINYKTLREEGEWFLLFNYIIPFPEVLTQSAQISLTSPGIRAAANTEAVCKFLVNLSMDFSSYYNRVHILGVSLNVAREIQ
ncbi:hypothetical protein FKM82_004464 [Ascaphus truei]